MTLITKIIISVICIVVYINANRITNMIIAICNAINNTFYITDIIEYIREKRKNKKV